LSLATRFAALRRSPVAGRITRYTVGSVVAVATSEVAFAVCYASGIGTTPSSVIAFVVGALPNWVLNRRWAWRRTGRLDLWREVVGYALTSVVSLVASAAATGWTSGRVHELTHDHTLRVVLVTASYLATYAVLFVAKFVLYERVIFVTGDRPVDPDAKPRSRHHVRSMTRPNRTP